VEWSALVRITMAVLVLQAVAWFYTARRPNLNIVATVRGLSQLLVFTPAAAALSYAVVSTAGPSWDATFLAWDRALGLDWLAYLAFVNANPELGYVMNLAYRSLLPQIIIVFVALGFSGRLRELREYVLAFVLAGTATVLISAALPAMAMFVHLGLTHGDFPNLSPAAAFVHVEHIKGLRDGSLRVIPIGEMEGIITFPSFHAALGLILARALWSVPLLRWPGVALNALLIAATPVDGGHYFVDVIAGAAIAGAAILAARWATRAASDRSVAHHAAPVLANT
jgi:membrane-associated phospholipid phosphatase